MIRPLRALIAAAALLTAAPATAETLQDALVDAYNNSGLLEQNRALLRAADEDVAVAVSATLPVLNWAISASNRVVKAPFKTCVTLLR